MLSPKAYYPGFENAPTLEQKRQRVPLVDLPIPMGEILKNLDAVIITHTHVDHWDECAAKVLYLKRFQSSSKMLQIKKLL